MFVHVILLTLLWTANVLVLVVAWTVGAPAEAASAYAAHWRAATSLFVTISVTVPLVAFLAGRSFGLIWAYATVMAMGPLAIIAVLGI